MYIACFAMKLFVYHSNEFNNYMGCHHKLSFNVSMTLFLFKTPTMFGKRVILYLYNYVVLFQAFLVSSAEVKISAHSS